jgi:hypothetical protein
LDLAGEPALSIRLLILPLALAAIAVGNVDVRAQGAFPAPLPGQAAPAGASPFPPVNAASPNASVGGPGSFPVNGAAPIGAAPMGGGGMMGAPPQQAAGGPPDACMKDFLPLRQEAEKRGKLIKAASDRHATPDEACKLIRSFGQAETKMISFVETHMAKCGIPAQVADQLKNGHKNTETMQTKVCAVAAQPRGPAGPSLSEVLGSAAAVPEATASRKGGSTFDTLNGNVLAR